MSDKTLNSYPDFGELSKVFEAYKAGMRTEPLLAEGAMDSIFKDAPAKMTLMRRIRMQWAVGITGLIIVTAGFIMELSRTMPVKPNIVPAPIQLAKTDSTPAPCAIDTGLQVTDFRLSKYAYDSHLNLDSAVRVDPALGAAWRQADWNDLKKFCTDSGRVDTLIETLKLPLLVDRGVPGGEGDSVDAKSDTLQNFYVTLNRTTHIIRNDTGWHYFISRWDHHRPQWWQSWGQIDHDHLVLGQWHDMNIRVLAVRRKVTQNQTTIF